MDSKNKRSSLVHAPSKSRLAQSIAKVLHIKALTEKSSDSDAKKKEIKSQKTKKREHPNSDDEDLKKAVEEAFMAKLFASISSIKAAYAELQTAQSPYDADAIHSADRTVISELKNLSELKQSYLKDQLYEKSPEKTLFLTEAQEQSSLLKTYEITAKKLDSQLKLKDSEITFLKEKLAEATDDLNPTHFIALPKDISLSDLRPTHFISFVNHTAKSIQTFVRSVVDEMESSNWDLIFAANAIQPGINFWESSHKVFAFQSFVCREMFEGFNRPFFSVKTEKKKRPISPQTFFDRFSELKSLRSSDYLAWKPKSKFASFCRVKYLKLIHPSMESSLFGDLNMRNVIKGGVFPETGFFIAFAEMARSVWLLHCLAFSFAFEVEVFEVAKGVRFSEVFMESLNDEVFGSSSDPRVGFPVFPGL